MRTVAVPAKSGAFLVCGIWLALVACLGATPLAVVFSSADDVGVNAPAFEASGRSVGITLSFAPTAGTPLTVVDQSGLGFIAGEFSNLAHGQSVVLEHGGKTYRYVANYFGGDGNDLVLHWAATRPLAWGYNDVGQLGNGGTASAKLATAVDTSGVLAGRMILAVAMGGKHSLALCSDGTLAAWGANNTGQLGNNSMAASSLVPVRVVQTGVLAGKTVIAIAAGDEHSLALCSDGTVAAWGASIYGMIGDGALTDRRVPVAVNTSGVLAGKTVVRIAAGRRHSLAVCSDGTAVGWGLNGSGQLGNGQTLASNPLPLAVDQSGALAGKQIAALAGGEHFTLALCSDGTLASWGSNNSGLGTGFGYFSSKVPLLVNQSGVLAGRTVVEIATGYGHALARCADGFLAGWGYNTNGALGDGTTSERLLPVAVDQSGILAGRLPRKLAAGRYFSSALNHGGLLASWGGNGSGQLGDASIEDRRSPVEVISGHLPEGERFCGIGNGSGANHAVGLVALPFEPRMRLAHADFRVRLDGSATLDFGAVPPGGPAGRSLVIHNDGIEPLTIADVSLSGEHAGDFSYGPPPASPIAPGGSAVLPVTFAPGAGFHRRASLRIESNDPYRDAFVVDLSATITGTLAVTLADPAIPALAARTITVTGCTISPTLGAQPPVGATFTLVENAGSEFITGAFANLEHGQIISLNHAGTAYRFIANYHGGSGNDLVLQWAATRPVGWGDNFADQLLTGSTDGVFEATAIPTIGALAGKTIVSTTSGFGFNIALCGDGSVVGWGRNNAGQLGSGGASTSSPPVEVNRGGVLAGRTVIAVDAGYDYCLALCGDGGIVAWGGNYGSLPANVAPAAAMSGKSVVAIDAGGYQNNLALCSDGSVFQWTAGPSFQPAEVHRLRTLRNRAVDAISAGGEFSLALCSDGTLVSWGRNSGGKLGIGAWDDPPVDEPLPVDTSGVLAGRTVRAISAGSNHAIVLCEDGTLATWGSNSYGELGNGLTGSSNHSNSPVAVVQSGILAGRTPVSVAASLQSCFIGLADGGVAAWGEGPLGKGDSLSSSTPVEVLTRSLATGERLLAPTPGHYSNHNLALVALPHRPRLAVAHESGLRVTHDRFTADLGATAPGGTLETTFTLRNDGNEPLAITGVSITGRDAEDFSVTTAPPPSIAAGTSAPLVVRFTAGSGFAREAGLEFSSNDPDDGIFEIGLAATVVGTLSAVWPDAAAVPLSAVGLTANGSTVSLSLGHQPQTGTELTLVEITGMDFINGRFGNLAQGQEVVLEYGGKAYRFVANYYGGSGNDLVLQWAAVQPFGWGLNTSGQLGDGTSTSRSLPGRASAGVLAGRSTVAMAARANHTLALCADGGLAAWGSNSSGQFGRGNSTSSNVPVAAGTTGVMIGKTVAAIAAGSSHTLALCTDGTLAAWGANPNGQLGNGSTDSSTNPVAVDSTGVLAGRRVVAIAAGNFHSLALCSDGMIAAWGNNLNGQLGDLTNGDRSRPVEVTDTGVLAGRRVVAIAAGAYHSLALCDDGTIAAWGSNEFGKLGDGGTANSNVPVAVDRTGVLDGKEVVGIAGGEGFSLALCDDGLIAAWGDNSNRQFGNGGTVSSPLPVWVDMRNLPGGRIVRQVSAGRSHGLAQGPPGTPAAWGSNTNGKLGDGTTSQRSKPVSVGVNHLAIGETFVQAATTQGNDHSIALVALPYIPRIALQHGASAPFPSSGGSLFFEPNGIGITTTETLTLRNNGIVPLELGMIAITGPNAAEFQITTSPPAVVAAGESATLAITFTAGAGFGRSAELYVPSNDPYIPEIRLALESAGSGALVASYATGTEVPLQISKFYPAGSTASLSLDHLPPTGTSLMLVEVTGREFIRGAFSNLAPGQEVALDFNGRGYRFIANYYGGSGNDLVLEWAAARPVAWGRNASGQLGTGDALQRSIATDIATGGVLAGRRVTALAAGAFHSLALCADGTLAAWGSNGSGRLGNGSTTSSSLPVAVTRSGAFSGKTVVSISAGSAHSLALCSDGTVFAWGSNGSGQLGIGSTSTSSSLPVAVTTTGVLAGKFVTAIAAGDLHSLALCSDGTVVSWGSNSFGHLGTRPYLSSSAAPVAVHMAGVLAGKTVIAIAAGASHSLALCADGTLTAWGLNSSGQLGFGSTSARDIPELVDTSGVLSGRTVVAIAAGSGHSLALCADGAVAAWGDNRLRQLGNGGISNSLYPVLTNPAGFAPRRISCGYYHSMMSGSPGSTALWGRNAYGQLGDGTLATRSVPTTLSAAWELPGDRILTAVSGPAAEHTLGLAAEPAAPRVEEWRLLHFQTRDNAGLAADSATPANDGVTNLMKFATGLNPWTYGSPATSARIGADGLWFTYPRAKAALADGVSFRIEASRDLEVGSWQTLDALPEIIEELDLLQKVSVVVPVEPGQPLFLRLRVQSP